MVLSRLITIAATGLYILIEATTYSFADDFMFAEEFPVVVNASRINQSILSAPTSVTILDSAIIEASGVTNIADIFRLVPGMQVAHVSNRKFAVSYHGGAWDDTNWIQVIINGRSTYMPMLSVIDWDSVGVHIEDIEKIEVIRGPSSSAYGSNSFTAAINIITKSVQHEDKKTFSTRFGPLDEQRNYARYTTSYENLYLRFAGSTLKSDGYKTLDDSKTLLNGNLDFEYQPSVQNSLQGFFTFSNGITSPISDPFIPDDNRRDRYLNAYSGHLIWQNHFSTEHSFKLSAFHNQRIEDDLTPSYKTDELLSFDLTGTIFENNANEFQTVGRETFNAGKSDIEFQYSWLNPDFVNLVIAAGIQTDTLKSPVYFETTDKHSNTTQRLAINLASTIYKDLNLNFGLLFERIDTTDHIFSPRLALNYFLTPLQAIRLTVSQASRNPSLLEDYIDVQIQTNEDELVNHAYLSGGLKKPEKIQTIELAYQGKLKQVPFNWEVKLYHNHIKNNIWFVQNLDFEDPSDNSVISVLNSGQYKVYGVEADLLYRTGQYDFYKLFFNHAFDEDSHFNTLNPKNYIESNKKTPRFSIGGMGSWKFNNWFFSATALYNTEVNWQSFEGRASPSYFRLDANIRKIFALDAYTDIELKLGGQNINGEYYEYSNDFAIEPKVYFSASIKGF